MFPARAREQPASLRGNSNGFASTRNPTTQPPSAAVARASPSRPHDAPAAAAPSAASSPRARR
eukprot:8126635-Pyramimonas_sp.AAC.1